MPVWIIYFFQSTFRLKCQIYGVQNGLLFYPFIHYLGYRFSTVR